MKIGIDLGGTKIEIIALSAEGETLYQARRSTPRESYDKILKTLVEMVQEAEDKTGQTGSVGIGIPGTISRTTRLVKNANTQCLIGQSMQADLSQMLNREVRFSNDANCMAVSEAVDGAAAGYDVVLAFILGTGCGAGIAINGQVHDGLNSVAGEIGHVTLPWITAEELAQSDLCYCGHKGCVETWVSGTGFARDYERHTGEALVGEDIMKRVAAEDPAAIENIERYENRLARLCAHAINILDPDVIVFAGGVSNVERLYQNVPPQLSKYVFGNECETKILPAQHGDASGVRGAAFLWS